MNTVFLALSLIAVYLLIALLTAKVCWRLVFDSYYQSADLAIAMGLFWPLLPLGFLLIFLGNSLGSLTVWLVTGRRN